MKNKMQEASLFNERDLSALGSKIEPPYFFGAYDKFQQVGNDPFATEGWISHCKAMINQWNSPLFKVKISIKNLIIKLLRIPTSHGNIVDLIKKLLVNKEQISVLDVGGGFGDNFFYIENSLGPLSKRVSYVVVDNKTQCDFGRELYKTNKKIDFKTEIPEQNFDLVIVIGTIQYIENWKDFVCEITKKSIGSIFISRTPINVLGPSFVTIQSICPAFGSSALKKIGESNVNVISQSELDQTFMLNGFSICRSEIIKDYSEKFKRLPLKLQNIKYIDKQYVRSNQLQSHLILD